MMPALTFNVRTIRFTTSLSWGLLKVEAADDPLDQFTVALERIGGIKPAINGAICPVARWLVARCPLLSLVSRPGWMSAIFTAQAHLWREAKRGT